MGTSYPVSFADFVLGYNVSIKVCESQEPVMVQQVVDNVLELIWILGLREGSIFELVNYLGKL